jgi:hypothetical protein
MGRKRKEKQRDPDCTDSCSEMSVNSDEADICGRELADVELTASPEEELRVFEQMSLHGAELRLKVSH